MLFTLSVGHPPILNTGLILKALSVGIKRIKSEMCLM